MCLIGVLYLHDIKNSRVTLSPNIVGPREVVSMSLPPGVVVVTTHWSDPPTPQETYREQELEEQFCGKDKMVRYNGSRPLDSAWEAIQKLQTASDSVPFETMVTRLQHIHDRLLENKGHLPKNKRNKDRKQDAHEVRPGFFARLLRSWW